MQFVGCKFNGSSVDVPSATFEGCTFTITDLAQLPAAWQCVDCTVIYGDETFSYGQSGN